MAKHDTQNVSYMRKDTHFLADGVWYISTPCPKCGLVDEAVSWDDAKTPHHAGLIADQRHAACVIEMADIAAAAAGENEIRAAEYLLECQIHNFEDAQQRVSMIDALPAEHPLKKSLPDAKRQLDRHANGLTQAQRRLDNTKLDNRKG